MRSQWGEEKLRWKICNLSVYDFYLVLTFQLNNIFFKSFGPYKYNGIIFTIFLNNKDEHEIQEYLITISLKDLESHVEGLDNLTLYVS